MRNPRLSSLAVLIALAVAACGPSNSELKAAKETRYKADPNALMQAAKDVIEAKQYKLGKADAPNLTLETLGRWYNPEGQLVSENDDMRQVPDRSLKLTLVIKFVKDGDAYLIVVGKKLLRYFAGRPNPDTLADDDPSIPGWVQGKQDGMAFDLHDGLKAYAVPTAGGATVGAPTPGAATSPPADATATPAAATTPTTTPTTPTTPTAPVTPPQ
jgi:hypothetical protein